MLGKIRSVFGLLREVGPTKKNPIHITVSGIFFEIL